MCASRRKVVVVSPGDDIHALAVASKLATVSKGEAQIEILDTATLPAGTGLCYERSKETSIVGDLLVAESLPEFGERPSASGAGSGLVGLDSEEIRSLWWRRARLPRPAENLDEEFQEFAVQNTWQAILGWVDILAATANIVNYPDAERRAGRKLLQVETAARVGLNVPETFVGNVSSQARQFVLQLWQQGSPVVYKQLRPLKRLMMYTRRLEQEDLKRLHQLEHEPVMFQRYLRGTDVRVAVFGEWAWAAAGTPIDTPDVPDIRAAGTHVEYASIEIPGSVMAGIRKMQHTLGLRMGIYDFIVDETGEWQFLEVNPSGQWLFIETRACIPLAEALAQLLWFGEIRPKQLCNAAPLTNEALQALLPPRNSEEIVERALHTPPVRVLP